MASGRPVLAYGQGGAAETVVPGVTGELFLDQSAEAVVGAVRKFESGRYDPAAIRSHALKFRKALFVQRFKKLAETEHDRWKRSGSHAGIGAEPL
jgi:glycosyltransferase involved in cell wall biosynthesis